MTYTKKLVTKLVLALSLVLPFAIHSAENSEYNMPVGVTEVSQSIFGLHMLIFWICVVIGIIVFGIIGLFLYNWIFWNNV